MRIVLINPYELGRQPFGLAQPAAWLTQAGFSVACIDLALEKLQAEVLADAGLVAIYLPMHTATRIAAAALPRIRTLAPHARLCVYGLYAPMNADFFRAQGVDAVLGGEVEPALLALAEDVRRGTVAPRIQVDLTKIAFMQPRRDLLPSLTRYAHLILPAGAQKVVAFAEGTRGCKHLCRHCPVVPVYNGTFRVVPVEIVLADIAQQVAEGAEHVSFGDPDFFNGPTHAIKIVRALHAEFPQVSYDCTIKIQHLIAHADLLPTLKQTGCLFITSAVESVDDDVLDKLAKNHTDADFGRAVALVRAHDIALSPTFVPFNPWTTLAGYVRLLQRIVELRLVAAVAPIQLTIRLLIPQGSVLLALPDFRALIEAFDPQLLGYPWRHRDARVDALQRDVQARVTEGEAAGHSRQEIFADIWVRAHAAAGIAAPALPADCMGASVPRLSEPWYCCAEPTDQQLAQF